MSSVRVGGAIAASFGYLRVAWSRAAGVMAASVFLVGAFQIASTVPSLAPIAGILRFFVLLGLGAMVSGALYRIGLAPDHGGDPAYAPGPNGFKWGALEWRVMGANLLLTLMLIVPIIVVLMLWGVALGLTLGSHADVLQRMQSENYGDRLAALGEVITGPAAIVTAAIFIPAIAALVYAGSRLSLYTVRAADTGSFGVGGAWALTRGAVLPLAVATLVILLVEVLAGSLSGAVAGVGATVFGAGSASARWGSTLGEMISAAINAPLFAGLHLYVYRAQRGETGVAATFA